MESISNVKEAQHIVLEVHEERIEHVNPITKIFMKYNRVLLKLALLGKIGDFYANLKSGF